MIYKGGVDSPDAKRTTTGYDLTVVELNPIPINTGSCNVFTWGIPTTSKNPDAAMKFLNLMFSNADINNLLAWGVEGVHYQVLEEDVYKRQALDESQIAPCCRKRNGHPKERRRHSHETVLYIVPAKFYE